MMGFLEKKVRKVRLLSRSGLFYYASAPPGLHETTREPEGPLAVAVEHVARRMRIRARRSTSPAVRCMVGCPTGNTEFGPGPPATLPLYSHFLLSTPTSRRVCARLTFPDSPTANPPPAEQREQDERSTMTSTLSLAGVRGLVEAWMNRGMRLYNVDAYSHPSTSLLPTIRSDEKRRCSMTRTKAR
jgi:hypothetical protein